MWTFTTHLFFWNEISHISFETHLNDCHVSWPWWLNRRFFITLKYEYCITRSLFTFIYIYFLHGIEILYGIHHCLHVNMDVIYTCGLEHGMHGRHSKYFGLFLGFRHSNAPIPSLHHFFLENHQAFHVSGRRYNIFIYIVIQLQCMLYVYTLNVDCVNIMYSTCIFDTLHCVYNVIHWASYIYICLRYMCIEYVLYMHNI